MQGLWLILKFVTRIIISAVRKWIASYPCAKSYTDTVVGDKPTRAIHQGPEVRAFISSSVTGLQFISEIVKSQVSNLSPS